MCVHACVRVCVISSLLLYRPSCLVSLYRVRQVAPQRHRKNTNHFVATQLKLLFIVTIFGFISVHVFRIVVPVTIPLSNLTGYFVPCSIKHQLLAAISCRLKVLIGKRRAPAKSYPYNDYR